MKNPFSADTLGEEKLKRNAVPLSYDNFFTANFGQLMPAFVQEVIPGDTIRIKSGTMLGIRGMPTIFPVQTKIRAGIEFYYVRNRTLMDNWEDFIFKTKDIEQAWLKLNFERAKKMISTGSLGDMFGVSTTKTSNGLHFSLSIPQEMSVVTAKVPRSSLESSLTVNDVISRIDWFEKYPLVSAQVSESYAYSSFSYLRVMFNPLGYGIDDTTRISIPSFSHTPTIVPTSTAHTFVYIFSPSEDGGIYHHAELCPFSISDDGATQSGAFSSSFIESFNSNPNNRMCFGSCTFFKDSNDYLLKCLSSTTSYSFNPFMSLVVSSSTISFLLDWQHPYFTNLIADRVIDATDDLVISDNEYVGSSPAKRVNALPFRAYEMICNYYYRNDKNNPYYLNGEPQYNQFIPTTADGADENLYEYHYRNWELDMFTSAVQSPQFGEAPLVGLTYNPLAESAEFTFDVTDADGVSVEAKATLGVDPDGNFDSIADFSKELPSANLRKLQQMVNYGISINDLRVTNAFQRFKENTLRKGLRYRNQLKSHMGVSVDYPDIDVPQYIGGFNGDIVAGQVTNTADSPNAGLGDYVGTLNGGIKATRDITCFCPEHGFIIGIFSFAPSPSYPQSTKKIMLKTDAFDYFQKEFSKIGFVPMHYSEVFPHNIPAGGSADDVFGYQKVNYDYLMNVDEIHCDFRTSLRDFVLGRTFAERPVLSESFVKVKPEQLNQIFVTDNIADAYGSNAKFMVAARFIVNGARPVSMFGQPSLE